MTRKYQPKEIERNGRRVWQVKDKEREDTYTFAEWDNAAIFSLLLEIRKLLKWDL